MEKMTPEAMKPDEAEAMAIQLARAGRINEAREIQVRISQWHPDRPEIPLSAEKVGEPENDLPRWIQESLNSFH
jgi:hypothetical protein